MRLWTVGWLLLLFIVTQSESFSINIPYTCNRKFSTKYGMKRSPVVPCLGSSASVRPEWSNLLDKGDDGSMFELVTKQKVLSTSGQELEIGQIIGDRKALLVFMRHVG